ncbi:MAG: magnesium chelatase subunit H, partial [Thermohalobaculum sp.]|nr:magnesium chelatase subunit H [Thermohalobaculum sp.]
MQKPISPAEFGGLRLAIVTLDAHFASAIERARPILARKIPGLELSLHAASDWAEQPGKLEETRAAIAQADIVIASMLFLDDQIKAILPALEARRPHCDAMIACVSAQEVIKLTKIGRLDMSKPAQGPMALLKKLRGKRTSASSGAGQMAMLRRIPKILRFIPGSAQDLRAYFLTMQYWLSGSDENVLNMIRLLIDRYADGPRATLRGALRVEPPVDYPEVGLYHPRLPERVTEDPGALPTVRGTTGTVGLLIMRSYVLSKDTGHFDGVIAALEARGLRVIPAFSSGLDGRPAIERFFRHDGRTTVDALVSLTGFSLVGGPAYNDAAAAEAVLAALDVPYIGAHAIEFQSIEQWGGSARGLMPIENTMMVAIPELDGATNPMVYGGRSDGAGLPCQGCEHHCVFDPATGRDMHVCAERAGMLAARVARLIALRRAARAERRLGVVLFNFPPNAGATGTAAYLSVFESLWNTLSELRNSGYTVDLPETVVALREAVLGGNATTFGTDANVFHRIPADTHVRDERHLAQIEDVWGPAPGRAQSDGASILVLGQSFGNVFVGIQPAFGWEGDPMRLLFEAGFAPTHAFSAFYRWLDRDFGAHAVLHFGTHGALEFMPGKQAGQSATSWPDRLIGELPNFYLYASNNPSEGAIARRRAAATLISYLTPPVAHAGLYRGLVDLKASLDRWRAMEPGTSADERTRLGEMIQAQAAALDLAAPEPVWMLANAEARVGPLADQVLELEYSLIPHGLHVVGEPMAPAERAEMLGVVADAAHGLHPAPTAMRMLADGHSAEAALAESRLSRTPETISIFNKLAETAQILSQDHEAAAIIRALDGRFIAPAPGGDLIRTTEILPTGRNLHGFDP